MSHRVVFAPEAEADLAAIFDYLAARGGASRALAVTERIVESCRGLALFPVRGTSRNDVRPGVRVIGVARRVSVGFFVQGDTVTTLRVLYGGRDVREALEVR